MEADHLFYREVILGGNIGEIWRKLTFIADRNLNGARLRHLDRVNSSDEIPNISLKLSRRSLQWIKRNKHRTIRGMDVSCRRKRIGLKKQKKPEDIKMKAARDTCAKRHEQRMIARKLEPRIPEFF